MSHSPPTILLVEDSEDDVFILKRALKQLAISWPVHIVTDGRQALDYLSGQGVCSDRQRFPLPSVIFLDLKLPYMNGFEFLTWLGEKPQFLSIPIIVLTGSAEPKDQHRARALGARSYLVKPPTKESLAPVFDALQSSPQLRPEA